MAAQRSRHIHGEPKTLAHPHLHDRQVALAHLNLLRQCRAGAADFGAELRHGHTQVIDQRFDRGLGPRRILPHQRVDRGQRVEEEMRFDLGLQHGQPQIRLVFLAAEQIQLPGLPRVPP